MIEAVLTIRRRLCMAFFAVMLLAALCLPACAETVPAAYRLGPEDVVAVTVQRHADYSGEFPIAPDGTIELPFVGKVKVTGQTITELTVELTKRLALRLRAPEVTVTLLTPREQRVYVVGAVKLPGAFDVKETWRITEALAAAGGIVPIGDGTIAPDPRDCTVTVMRIDGKRLEAKLADVLAAQADANAALAAGDVVIVKILQLLPVYVMGTVQHPGLCELRPGQGVLEALSLAGGMIYPPEDVTVTLQRGHERRVVSPRSTDPLPLEDGDVLTVEPLRAIHVTVSGQVHRPGVYDLKAGEGVLTALTLAGGVTPKASLHHVTVAHAGGRHDEIDLASAMQAGGAEPPMTLGSGDLVVVPENTRSIAVLGYVGLPGNYPLSEDKPWTLTEVLGLANGLQGKIAGLNHVALLRTEASGKQVRQIVDVEKFFKKGDPSGNPLVQPGDVIYVPRSSAPDWGLIFQAITSLSVFKTDAMP